MNNQDISAEIAASGRSAVLPDRDTREQPSVTIGALLHERARTAASKSRGGPITLLPTEHVGSYLVSLPRSRARQRPALLTFAIEERIGVPIDSVRVVEGPRGAQDGQTLALVCNRDILAAHAQSDQRLMPDFLLIPRPEDTDWAVWLEGDRALVRVADGTGFAMSSAMLSLIWRRAGQPSVTSLLDPLPPELGARDVAAAPPLPDAADLGFSFGQQRRNQTQLRSIGVSVAAICGFAIVGHMAFLAADTWALQSLAAQAQQRAQAAVAETLPGVTVTADAGPVLARLAPQMPTTERGAFLPLLTSITGALAELDTPLSFRRLAWSAQQNELVVLVQSNGLSDLQSVQQSLQAQGFTVSSGAASASEGGAEAELRISGGGA